MRKGLWLLMVMVLAFPAKGVSPRVAADLQQTLDGYLLENPLTPGVSASLVCPRLGGEWAGASGTVARGSAESLAPDHTFRIASNTKTYVAVAVLRLVQQGKLDLDGQLRTWLDPELARKLVADGYDLDRITLAQTLSHTAGSADHTQDPRFEEIILSDSQHQWTSQEQLRALVDWRDPVGQPGERFSYSDSGYIILGTIVEHLTGQSLGPAVRDLVGFADLDLDQTYWEYLEEPPLRAAPRAHQYFGELDVTGWNASFDLYGGGGIVTDAVEITTFMRALLKGQILPPELMTEMTGRGTAGYRLGLAVHDFDGHLAWGHTGFWNTFAYHVPSLDLTLGGSILNHDAAHCHELVARLIQVVAQAQEK